MLEQARARRVRRRTDCQDVVDDAQGLHRLCRAAVRVVHGRARQPADRTAARDDGHDDEPHGRLCSVEARPAGLGIVLAGGGGAGGGRRGEDERAPGADERVDEQDEADREEDEFGDWRGGQEDDNQRLGVRDLE